MSRKTANVVYLSLSIIAAMLSIVGAYALGQTRANVFGLNPIIMCLSVTGLAALSIILAREINDDSDNRN
jgi:hypothetical protein